MPTVEPGRYAWNAPSRALPVCRHLPHRPLLGSQPPAAVHVFPAWLVTLGAALHDRPKDAEWIEDLTVTDGQPLQDVPHAGGFVIGSPSQPSRSSPSSPGLRPRSPRRSATGRRLTSPD